MNVKENFGTWTAKGVGKTELVFLGEESGRETGISPIFNQFLLHNWGGEIASLIGLIGIFLRIIDEKVP